MVANLITLTDQLFSRDNISPEVNNTYQENKIKITTVTFASTQRNDNSCEELAHLRIENSELKERLDDTKSQLKQASEELEQTMKDYLTFFDGSNFFFLSLIIQDINLFRNFRFSI